MRSPTPRCWHWGKAAQRRCKRQGINAELAWCKEYYFENNGERVEAKLDSDAEIRLLDDDDLKLVAASRAKLNAALAEATCRTSGSNRRARP